MSGKRKKRRFFIRKVSGNANFIVFNSLEGYSYGFEAKIIFTEGLRTRTEELRTRMEGLRTRTEGLRTRTEELRTRTEEL